MAVLYSDVLSDGLVLNVKLVDSGLPSMKELEPGCREGVATFYGMGTKLYIG